MPYECIVRLRNLAYDRKWKRISCASVPVLSIGNLTTGGTGKTPCVEYVANFFREIDVRPVILSRGYGATDGPNDEALLLEENLPDVPHLLGADRVKLAETATEELEAELLILDDGFQHRRLERDMDVVLIDATNPWGYGYTLPRGLLREPVSSLRRADSVIITRADQAPAEEVESRVRRLNPSIPICLGQHKPIEWIQSGQSSRPIETLARKSVVAFCGLGNPSAFHGTLQRLGLEILDFREYPDHHPYSKSDVEELGRWVDSHSKAEAIVTSQKDLVKLRVPSIGNKELFALRIGMTLLPGRDRDDFHHRLRSLVQH